MKKPGYLLALGSLMLILAACANHLPTPLGTAIINVTPAEATTDGWSWQISGNTAGMEFTYPDDGPATCVPSPSVSCFIGAPIEATVRTGTDWTLAFEPHTAEGDTPAWTGTGPAAEVDGEAVNTVALVDFEIPSIGSEADVSVSLRRTHELRAESSFSAPGEPATLTLHGVRVGSTEADFEVAALVASCFTQTGGVRTTNFEVPDGFSVSGAPQSVSFARTDGQPSFDHPDVVCTYSGHDSENRPLSFHIVPAGD